MPHHNDDVTDETPVVSPESTSDQPPVEGARTKTKDDKTALVDDADREQRRQLETGEENPT